MRGVWVDRVENCESVVVKSGVSVWMDGVENGR